MEARCLQESARERMSEGVRMECVHREKGGGEAEVVGEVVWEWSS